LRGLPRSRYEEASIWVLVGASQITEPGLATTHREYCQPMARSHNLDRGFKAAVAIDKHSRCPWRYRECLAPRSTSVEDDLDLGDRFEVKGWLRGRGRVRGQALRGA
jgi:hypothetical protein